MWGEHTFCVECDGVPVATAGIVVVGSGIVVAVACVELGVGVLVGPETELA